MNKRPFAITLCWTMTCVSLAFGATSATASEINLSDHLNRIAFGENNQLRSPVDDQLLKLVTCDRNGYMQQHFENTLVSLAIGECHLEFKNVHQIGSNVRLTPLGTSPPRELSSSEINHFNCSDEVSTVTVTLQEVRSSKNYFEKQNSIVEGRKVQESGKLDLKLEDLGLDLGLAAGKTVEFKKTEAWKEAEDFGEETLEEYSFKTNIPPLTRRTFRRDYLQMDKTFDVSGTIRLEADVVVLMSNYMTNYDVGSLSSYASEKERTVQVNGQLVTAGVTHANILDEVKKYQSADECLSDKRS